MWSISRGWHYLGPKSPLVSRDHDLSEQLQPLQLRLLQLLLAKPNCRQNICIRSEKDTSDKYTVAAAAGGWWTGRRKAWKPADVDLQYGPSEVRMAAQYAVFTLRIWLKNKVTYISTAASSINDILQCCSSQPSPLPAGPRSRLAGKLPCH